MSMPIPGVPSSLLSGLDRHAPSMFAFGPEPLRGEVPGSHERRTHFDPPAPGEHPKPALRGVPGDASRPLAIKTAVELFDLSQPEARVDWAALQRRIWNTVDGTLVIVHQNRYVDQASGRPFVWIEYAEFELIDLMDDEPGDASEDEDEDEDEETTPAAEAARLPSLSQTVENLNNANPT